MPSIPPSSIVIVARFSGFEARGLSISIFGMAGATVIRPDPTCSANDFLHFIEEEDFSSDWAGLGLDVATDLWQLQNLIMAAPASAPIIRGTGGVRKMRFAPEAWRSGKSGAIRVIYAYFPEHWTVLLIMAYRKGRKETVTAAERQALKGYMDRIRSALDRLRQ